MSKGRTPIKPTFLWQAALILLPLLILSALGGWSLRQDYRLAMQEASLRAQDVADSVMHRVWTELTLARTNGTGHFSFEVDSTGRLLFPPSYEPLPTPHPLDLSQLNPEQTRLWQRLQTAPDDQDIAATIDAQRRFIKSGAPRRFGAQTEYGLGLLLVRKGDLREATDTFSRIIQQHPGGVGESGIPLATLARYQLYRLAAASDDPAAIESFCSNIVTHPTALTPRFFAEIREQVGKAKPGAAAEASRAHATCEKWADAWDKQETSRQLFAAARPYLEAIAPTALPHNESKTTRLDQILALPAKFYADATTSLRDQATHMFWFDGPEWTHAAPQRPGMNISDHKWLAIHFPERDTNHWFVCHPESELGVLETRVADGVRKPDYMGVGLVVAGRPIKWFAPDLHEWHYISSGGGKSAGGLWKTGSPQMASTILASANNTEHDVELLKANVYLTSPTELFRSQRIRASWLGLLILAATVAAAVGLTTAWRSFQRQLRLSEMKTNFVSSVSHELRAPIASVRLLAESLERGKVHEAGKQHEYFRFIVQECRRLSALIENVLDFSRIEQGRKQYEFEPTNVRALVRETVKLMEPYATDKGVVLRLETFNLQPSTFNSELNLDGRAIQQALVNLIDNAIKHSPKGETVSIGCEARGGQCLEAADIAAQEIPAPIPSGLGPPLNPQPPTLNLFVSDRGPGIPAEEREKIFERFYRLGSELRRETQGVGIGLSIVKHIVEAHGGRVQVESDIGKGSRFTIELPLDNRGDAERTEI